MYLARLQKWGRPHAEGTTCYISLSRHLKNKRLDTPASPARKLLTHTLIHTLFFTRMEVFFSNKKKKKKNGDLKTHLSCQNSETKTVIQNAHMHLQFVKVSLDLFMIMWQILLQHQKSVLEYIMFKYANANNNSLP